MRPPPMMPPDVDLRDFTFMPVDIVRLFGSDFHAKSTDGEWRAGMTLWLKSFHQVPAGSLPAGEIALARLAEFGRDLPGWQAVQDGALHGWTLCSDDRWYHKVVCEKALEGWIGKLLQRRSGAIGNAKRWGTPPDIAEVDRQLAEAAKALHQLAPGSLILRKCKPFQGDQQPTESPPDAQNEGHASQPDADPIAPLSVPDPDPIAEGSQGITNRKGKLDKKDSGPPLRDGTGLSGLSHPVDLRKQLYARAADLLGSSSGSLVTKLLQSTNQDIAEARAILEKSAGASPPKAYLMAAINRRANGSSRDLGAGRSSRDM